MPQATVIPVLGYPDVGKAVDWLCDAFGFTVRLRIGTHRAQLNVGDGAMAVTEDRSDGRSGPNDSVRPFHSVMVRVEDVDAHCAQARRLGARILQPPTDFPYGERQYTAEDLAGHVWTFSESIADVAPEDWNGTSVQL
jgi:uncharacterized glyoxalase superfamily protein PhnB